MRHVLVIAGSVDRADRLSDLCVKMGIEARTAPNAVEGMLAAALNEPALIVIDAADAWLGPLSVADEFRTSKSLWWVPFVIVGDEWDAEIEASQRGTGADCVVDGFDAPDFGIRFKRAVKRWALAGNECTADSIQFAAHRQWVQYADTGRKLALSCGA